jgi:hypothetical protein
MFLDIERGVDVGFAKKQRTDDNDALERYPLIAAAYPIGPSKRAARSAMLQHQIDYFLIAFATERGSLRGSGSVSLAARASVPDSPTAPWIVQRADRSLARSVLGGSIRSPTDCSMSTAHSFVFSSVRQSDWSLFSEIG